MIFDDATRAQIDAARPDASTWLGANAGSGKTRVLTDRVARLLLQNVQPQNILCLTYTKAAASEMQNRLFKRLGAWAMLDDDALRLEMAKLGMGDDLTPVDLRQARTLFALAIEAPGGLKIQTIHSFCAALLRRFPLEAEVSPQFTEIEDRAAELLRAEIVDDMAQGVDAPLISAVAAYHTDEDLSKLTRSIVSMRERFAAPLGRAECLKILGAPADLTQDQILRGVFHGDELDLFARIIPLFLAGSTTDITNAKRLGAVTELSLRALIQLEGIFLGKRGDENFCAKIDKLPTKKTQATLGSDHAILNDLMARVELARHQRLAVLVAEKSAALHAFAAKFLTQYEMAKQARGWLDFDDLILKTRALLTDKNVAAWVLYRIDGGIDHILVDEAQDTSPRQWDVIERLTDEFYSGTGTRDTQGRTLFVVGDKKQSIYSFQGADPLEFDRKAALFETMIKDAQQTFQKRSLDYSFRSSNAILRFVDTVFDPNRPARLDKDTHHIAFKSDLPGRVDLWPNIPKANKDDDRHWTDPLDRKSEKQSAVILAEKIADEIESLLRTGATIPDDGAQSGEFVKRPVRAGDFLILVQRRGALFSEIIRACKAKGLPIAGADRLKIGAELAVKDLGALLRFLATPDDSLSLATALKSPLFGWSEQQLFDLAHRRETRHLWEALRVAKNHPETLAILNDLRGQVDFLRPFELIERILTRHSGRMRLLGRLGTEAEDGINALLSQALAYERGNVPSLTGFIEWMQTDDLEIKRQIDTASDQIRVMTVHGAKGLEAPIVILPETSQRNVVIKDSIIPVADAPLWKPNSTEMPQAIEAAIEIRKEAERAERLRLFYVAATRAEKWLIIASEGELGRDGSSWFSIASDALDHINAQTQETTGLRRFQEGDWDGLPQKDVREVTRESPVLEPEFTQTTAIYTLDPETLSPSDLGGPKALASEAGQDAVEAMAYGTLVHQMLESEHPLSTKQIEQIAQKLSLSQAAIDRAEREVQAVLSNPDFAAIFAPNALAEVPVTATVGGQRLHGIIDRLLIETDKITLIDFKTNRKTPDSPSACPEGILRQMGAYAAMLSQMYPNHHIETSILWTATCELMPLAHGIVSNALWRSPYLDAAHTGS